MKKALAIVLALMLLLTSAALAENAKVLTLNNLMVRTTADGAQNTVDLTGASMTFAAGMNGEIPTIQLDVTDGDEKLLGAVIQITGGQVLVSVDGMSRPVAVAIPAEQVGGTEAIAALFAKLPELKSTKLPAFGGVTIPKINLMSVGSLVGAVGDENAATFDLPYEKVKGLLTMLSMFRSSLPESVQSSVGQLFDIIDNMTANGNGFALNGAITNGDDASTLSVNIIPVEAGVADEEAATNVTLVSAENQLNLVVSAQMGEDALNLGELAVTSVPDAAELNMSLDMMDMISLGASVYPVNGAQMIAFELNALGQVMKASLEYGQKDGMDYADYNLESEGMAAMSAYMETKTDENGGESGTLSVTADVFGDRPSGYTVYSEIAEYAADFAFRGIDNADAALNIESATEEERTKMLEEFNTAISGLTDRLAAAQPAA